MTQKSFQDNYPDIFAHCYGCGRLNEHGHQIKSHWDGEESVAYYLPKPYHIAIPGYVYGGLLASLIDCHGTGTAAAALYKAAKELDPDAEPNTRTLTASLHVDYLKPTPLGIQLEVPATTFLAAQACRACGNVCVPVFEVVCLLTAILAVVAGERHLWRLDWR